MKRFVTFDIHGEVKNLQRCLIKSNFNRSSDLLISCGDLCDRGRNTNLVMDELLTISNLILVKGNHDIPFYDFLKNDRIDKHWYYNWGGDTTVISYRKVKDEIRQKHIELLEKQVLYYLDDQGNLFVHSGIVESATIEQNSIGDNMYFNDNIYYHYYSDPATFDETFIIKDKRIKRVFAGHSVTKDRKPIITEKYINGDTGCGKGGVLTIMNIDDLKFWQG